MLTPLSLERPNWNEDLIELAHSCGAHGIRLVHDCFTSCMGTQYPLSGAQGPALCARYHVSVTHLTQ